MDATFYLAGTASTPEIRLDAQQPHFSIVGKSFPENAEKFYRPVIQWLNELGRSDISGKSADWLFQFDYLNSSTIYKLMEVISSLEDLNHAGWHIVVHWHFDAEDEEMRKIGQDYASHCSVRVELAEL